MTPLDSSIIQLLSLHNVGARAWGVPLCEWGRHTLRQSAPNWDSLRSSGSDLDASSFLRGDLANEGPRSPGWTACLSDTRYHPTTIDPSAAFGVKDHLSVLSGLATSDDGLPYPYPALELYSSQHICSNLENPSPSAHVNEPCHHHALYSGQDEEESFETTNFFGPSPVDIPLRDNAQSADILNKNTFPDISPWTDDLSCHGGIVQIDDPESPSSDTHLHFKQHLMVHKGPVRPCEWINENGTICGGELTRASLPEHLATHGIKNMPRDHLMKCNWFGCRKKNLINRESIVRHVREVHLRMKRFPKRVKKPHL